MGNWKMKWFWIILLFCLGLFFVINGLVDMYAFEIQPEHETLKDAIRDAREATRGKWIPGVVILMATYLLLLRK